MIRWVIRDYIDGFRWQNIKEQYKFGPGYLCFNILLLVPLISTGYDMDGRTLASFLINLPVAFALFSAMPQLMALPKMMYLCPMSRDMRREYVIKGCVIRIIVPILLGLPGIVWSLVKGMFDWICVIGILLNILLFAVIFAMGINVEAYAKKVNGRQGVSGLDDIFGFRRIASIVITLLINIIYVSAIGEETPWWVKVIPIAAILLISLPITISCMREWPAAVEQAASYESSGVMWRSNERTGR